MERFSIASDQQKQLQNILDEGVTVYGAGAFGKSLLRKIQALYNQTEPQTSDFKDKLALVSSREPTQVLHQLFTDCNAKGPHTSANLYENFWYADSKKSVFYAGHKPVEKVLPQFAIKQIETVFCLREDVLQKMENLGLHFLCSDSHQAPEIKKNINNKAVRPLILVDGTKGHTEELSFSNRNIDYVALAGPNYASEIDADASTGIHIAARTKIVREKIEFLLNMIPTFFVETSDDPEYLEAVGVYKNLMTFAYGIAVNYLKEPKQRTDFYFKLLKDFKDYAQILGMKSHRIDTDIKNLGLAFFGDTWMCTVHGSSDLSGKRSRNYTVATDVGLKLKEKQCDFRENFVELIAQRYGIRTVEGYNSFLKLNQKGVVLPVLSFIKDALAGQDLRLHPYLKEEKRRGYELLSKQKWHNDFKNLCFYLKKNILDADQSANAIALVMTKTVQEILSITEKATLKEHMLKVLVDVSQEEVPCDIISQISIESLKEFIDDEATPLLSALVEDFDAKGDKFKVVLDVLFNNKK